MKILLVIDVQEKYLKFYDGDFVERINERIKQAEAEGMCVFYAKNIPSLGNSSDFPFAKNLYVASDNIYEKTSPSAFSNSAFKSALKEKGVTEIEVIGADGNCCVRKTCIDAINEGYKVSLNLDLIGAGNVKIFEKTLDELSNLGVEM